MDVKRIVKWVLIIGVAFFIWTKVLPWIRNEKLGSTATPSSSPGGSCISTARRASELWGSGLARFVNPPYDVAEWSRFQGNVNAMISAADAACVCADPSCQTARDAMRDLRGLVSDLDTSIRNGSSPPSDAVQRQESIDNQIEAAAVQVGSGR